MLRHAIIKKPSWWSFGDSPKQIGENRQTVFRHTQQQAVRTQQGAHPPILTNQEDYENYLKSVKYKVGDFLTFRVSNPVENFANIVYVYGVEENYVAVSNRPGAEGWMWNSGKPKYMHLFSLTKYQIFCTMQPGDPIADAVPHSWWDGEDYLRPMTEEEKKDWVHANVQHYIKRITTILTKAA